MSTWNSETDESTMHEMHAKHHAQNYFTEKRAETRVIIVLVVRCRHSNHINIEVLLSLNYFYQTICVLYIEKKWALFVKQFISTQ